MPPGNDANWAPVGSDDTYQYSTAAVSVFWPEAEYAKLIARWPHLSAHVGATWDEHRRQVERPARSWTGPAMPSTSCPATSATWGSS